MFKNFYIAWVLTFIMVGGGVWQLIQIECYLKRILEKMDKAQVATDKLIKERGKV